MPDHNIPAQINLPAFLVGDCRFKRVNCHDYIISRESEGVLGVTCETCGEEPVGMLHYRPASNDWTLGVRAGKRGDRLNVVWMRLVNTHESIVARRNRGDTDFVREVEEVFGRR